MLWTRQKTLNYLIPCDHAGRRITGALPCVPAGRPPASRASRRQTVFQARAGRRTPPQAVPRYLLFRSLAAGVGSLQSACRRCWCPGWRGRRRGIRSTYLRPAARRLGAIDGRPGSPMPTRIEGCRRKWWRRFTMPRKMVSGCDYVDADRLRPTREPLVVPRGLPLRSSDAIWEGLLTARDQPCRAGPVCGSCRCCSDRRRYAAAVAQPASRASRRQTG